MIEENENTVLNKRFNILIVAGEASGDLLGSALVNELKTLQPNIAFWGIGGKSMKSSGVNIVFHVNDLGVTGFTEVVLKFRHILKVFRSILSEATTRKPDLAILIDYPDFNLRLAKRLKKMKIPVVYYVSPQMWAWRSGRVKIIKKYIAKMMVLFPFEETWYRQRGAEAKFVGHPVLDRVRDIPDKKSCRKLIGIRDDEFVIAMLPGSRFNEVKRTLPVMLKANDDLLKKTNALTQNGKKIRFIIPLAETMPEDLLPVDLANRVNPVKCIMGKTMQIVKAADFAWVTSGTASLETALLHTPQIVVYKTSFASYTLAKLLIKVDFISIANLILKSPVAKELIQKSFNAENLITETLRFMNSEETIRENQIILKKLDDKFGSTGASKRAANTVLEVLEKTNSEVVC